VLEVVIVDDEKPSLDELEYILSECGFTDVIATFTSSTKALEFIKSNEPDLVFLDVNMPEITGMGLADEMNRLGLRTKIIFATAYDEYAIKAFEKDAVDYILKPYEKDRIFKAIRKVRDIIERSSRPANRRSSKASISKLAISKGDKFIFIDVDDILYAQFENGEIFVHSADDTYSLHDTLTNLEEKLPEDKFFRTHRAYIVNINKVAEVSPYFNNTLMLKVSGSSNEIPVSRSNVKAFKKALNI
jgi:DNA-binding LytR/AlgR family response regulator